MFPACWILYNLTKSQKSEQAIQIKPLGSNHISNRLWWKGICNPISCLTCEGANRRQTSVIRDLSRNSSAAFRSFSGFSKTRNRVYKIAFKIQSLFRNINQKYSKITDTWNLIFSVVIHVYFVTCNQRVILTAPKIKHSNILKEPNISKMLNYCKLANSIDCSKDKRPTGLNGHLSVNCTCLICKSMQFIMTIKNIYRLWVGILRALVWHVSQCILI